MGHNMARLLHRRRVDVLMLGLNNSGKTTILYKILRGEKVLSVPTFGFNMEVLPFGDIELDVMDVGGCEKLVPLWKHYLTSASAIIYVMDCSDVNRMDENKALLTDIMNRPERKGIPLLVIVNKADNLQFNLKPADLQLRLDLQNICKIRKFKVHMVSAETGAGLGDAFTWLCAALGSGNASKKLKRIHERQAKQEREAINKKRRKREADVKASNETLSDHYDITEDHDVNVYETQQRVDAFEEIDNSSLTENNRTSSNESIESRVFSFSESYIRINDFFKSKANEIEHMMTGATRINPEQEAPHDAQVTVERYADTLSTEPHSPLSPRRAQSMLRHEEFLYQRDKARLAAIDKQNETSPRSSLPNEEQQPENKSDWNFEKLLGFFNRTSSEETQESVKPNYEIPHSSKVLSRRRLRSDECRKGMRVTESKPTNQNQKNKKAKVRQRSKSSGDRPGRINPTTPESKRKIDQFSNNQSTMFNKNSRSSIFAIIANIKLTFTGKKKNPNEQTHDEIDHDYKVDQANCDKDNSALQYNGKSVKVRIPHIQVQPSISGGED